MRGIPENNFPAFNEAAESLRVAGYMIVNPAENEVSGLKFKDYIREDIKEILDKCDSIALMPGWEKSEGSGLEASMACALGLDLFIVQSAYDEGEGTWNLQEVRKLWVQDMLNPPTKLETVCEIANSLVSGARRSSYGHPLLDFSKVAGMFNGLFGPKLKKMFTPMDLAMVMMLVKLSREAHCPKKDNRVDMAGYAQVLDTITEGWEEVQAKVQAKVQQNSRIEQKECCVGQGQSSVRPSSVPS